MGYHETYVQRVIPDKVSVKVTDAGGFPLASVSPVLTFKSDCKNDFTITLTRNSVKGEYYEISRAQIVDSANAMAGLFIMGYGNIEHSFTSKISVSIGNSADLKAAIDAYHVLAKVGVKFYPGYLEDLEYHLEETGKLEKSEDFKKLEVECRSEPAGTVSFEILPPR